jgi:hypothetical protein
VSLHVRLSAKAFDDLDRAARDRQVSIPEVVRARLKQAIHESHERRDE